LALSGRALAAALHGALLAGAALREFRTVPRPAARPVTRTPVRIPKPRISAEPVFLPVPPRVPPPALRPVRVRAGRPSIRVRVPTRLLCAEDFCCPPRGVPLPGSGSPLLRPVLVRIGGRDQRI
jgi:hypothetical protein